MSSYIILPVTSGGGGGSGTVTSVDMTVPSSLLTVTGNPITTSGTLAVALVSQTQNQVFAAPNGANGAPSFRALVSADLPTTTVTPGSYTSTNLTVDAYGRITAASSGAGGGVSSFNTLTGAITLAAGTNITLGTVGNTITVNSASIPVSSVFGRTGAVTAQSGDYSTNLVTESGNLYFTNARAIASTLTGYTSGAGTITSADTVLSAIQKLNGNTAALVTGVSSVSAADSTLTITPTSGAVTAKINLGNTNSWSATQTFSGVNMSGLSASQAVVTDGSKNLASLAYTSSNNGSTIASRDSNGNTAFNNYIGTTTATVSAAQTISMTAGSARFQRITGSSTVKFNLPNATTLITGTQFEFNNNSSGSVTVYLNDGTTLLLTLVGGGYVTVICTDNSTTNGVWDYHWGLASTNPSPMPNVLTTTGDIIYSSSGSTASRLGIGSNGQVLTVVSGLPAWQALGTTGSFNNLAVTGTGGNGYLNLVNQSSQPPTPTSSATLYANASGYPTWLNTSGYATSMSSAALSASRTFSWPDATGNIVVDSATQTLTNKTISGGSNTITNLNGSNIASGTVAAARGGTGLDTSSAANGTLLIGNGSGLTLATLTAGSGISITNGSGSVSIAVASSTYLALAGGTMTGNLILNADPTAALGAATKQYVDALTNGLKWKALVQVATTGSNITLSGEQTIDGVTTSSSRVLVKDQSTSSQNGIYVSSSGAWARSTDCNTANLINSAAVDVTSGSTNANKAFTQTATVVTLGTDPVTWVNFLNTSYTAGNGLNLSGQTFSVLANGSTLDVSGSGVKVATGGITNNEVNASAAIARSKLAAGEVFTAALVESVVTLTDAATIAVNATLGNIFTVTLGGNRTLGNPTGAVNGQKFVFVIKQDATGSRTLAFDTNYAFGTDLTSATLSTAPNAVDYIGVIYNSSSGKFNIIALARGY